MKIKIFPTKAIILIVYLMFIFLLSLFFITKASLFFLSTENSFLVLIHPALILLILGFVIGLRPFLFNLEFEKKIFIRKTMMFKGISFGAILTLFTVLISLQLIAVHIYIYLLIYIVWFILGFIISRSIKQ